MMSCLLICCTTVDAQTSEEAASLINQQDFAKAYKRIQSDNNYQTDAYLQYLLGLCYLYSDASKSSALSAFNYAYDAKENRGDTRIPGEVYYYMGVSKHREYDFVSAMNHFSEYKVFHQNFYGNDNKARYDHAVLMEDICRNAVDIIENNRLKNTVVHPVSFPLNTSYNDYYPVIPSKSEQLMYASNRRTDKTVINFGYGEAFLEEENAPVDHHMFYGLKKKNGNWNVQGDNFNFGMSFIAPISFSSDGETLLMLMGNSEDVAQLYIINKKNSKWQTPIRLPQNINLQGSNIKGGALAANSNRIYFSSNRPGGLGGYDIYVTNRKSENSWSDPENLGAPINTAGNEITPYISANMEELYFSSDNHETIGYYDVFVSRKSGTAWQNPQNLGYPVNSTYNDICYTKSADGVKEMLSSDREIFMNIDAVKKEAGEFATEANSSQNVFSRGNYDIYEVTRFKDKMPLCIVSGVINIKKDGNPVPFYMQVKKDGDAFNQPFIFEPPALNEKYFMVLRGHNSYAMNLIYCYDSVEVQENIFAPVCDTLYDFQFSVPKDTYQYEFNADIELENSMAFGKTIATHIKASKSDFVTTASDDIDMKKRLEDVRMDALVLIMDKVTLLGKKEVFQEIASIEDRIEYVHNIQAFETDPELEGLMNQMGLAFEKSDISYLIGLTEVMRHKDGKSVKPDSAVLEVDISEVFDKRNKIVDDSKKSLQAIADWVLEENDASLEFVYFGNPADIDAQERVEELKKIFTRFGLEDSEKMSGFIESNFVQVDSGKIRFQIQR